MLRDSVKAAAVILVLLMGLTGCSGPKPVTMKSPASDGPAYVDPKLCAGCHPAIAKTYRETGMGRSFYRATAAKLDREDFARNNRLEHGPSERSYQMVRRGDRFFMRRHQKGYGGGEANVMDLEIHYVMGSGNHARSYLHRTAENRLLELPVGWYAEQGGRWAMSPGFDRANHPDFRRAISYSCMFCHNGYPAVPSGQDLPGADPVYPAGMPEGIDCQRCHGPGLAHTEAARARQPAEKIRAAIVNPKRLPPERQLEVCMQCHLETTSWPLPSTIQRIDRGTFSFRPGEPLAGYALHFDHPRGSGREAKFEIASSAYRLRQSACFLKSNGAMQCTTCHNPHRSLRGEEARAHYAAVCRTCHQKAHAPSPDCAGCHMPKRRTEDVVHVVMTDHKILRRPPPNPLAPRAELTDRESTYRGEVALYYPPGLPEGAHRDLYLALAQVAQGSNLARGIPQLEAALGKHRPANAEFYFQLAQAQWKNGQRGKATESYQQALERNPGFVPALRSLGAALVESGDGTRAIEMIEKARTLAPNDASVRHELARAYQRAGKLADAAAEASAAVRLDPYLTVAHETLGGVYQQAGDVARAETAYREAIRLQPEFPEAHSDLGNLLSTRGDFAQAEFHFQAALRADPRQTAVRYNYAVSLAMARRFDDAQLQFARTLKDAPGMAEAHEGLGNLSGRRRDWAGAVRHYQDALRARPGFDRALLGLGTALGMIGDAAGARTFLRQAAQAGSPAVRGEAVELLRALEQAPGR